MTIHAQQSNYHFSHTVLTTAKAEKIWQIWTDVSKWNTWDAGLKKAKLDGIFKEGAKGILIPDRGPKSKFIIEKIRNDTSYVLKTKIPFGWLIIHRYIERKNGLLSFTHDVQFTGLLKKTIGNKIGARYRQMLPVVMEKIKIIAETDN